MALPLSSRVKRAADFQRIFRRGRAIRGAFLFLKYVCRSGGAARASVVVSRGAATNSVERNRIRRIVSTSIEGTIDQLPPCDFLVIIQRNPRDEEVVRGEVLWLLGELAARAICVT